MSNGRNISKLLKRIQILAIFAAGVLGGPIQLASRLSKNMKRGTTIAALVAVAVLAGHAVSAQVAPSPSLKTVAIPQPDNIGDFIKDKVAVVALGKSLFWDMQLGTDGIQSCASCHFHAGVDSRAKNQINPGSDQTFNPGGGPNYHLTAADYPFHKLTDPEQNSSTVVSDSNDVTGSQGVFRSDFVDIVPGSAKDNVTPIKDDVFNVKGTNVRRVTPRNTPSVINAVFNFRNFWNGSAQNVFNGVNSLGLRDPKALVLKATNRNRLEDVSVKINNASLASQAVAPPLNALETAAEKLPIAPSLVAVSPENNTVTTSDANGNIISSDSADLPQSTAGVSGANNQNSNSVSSRRPSPGPTTTINRIGRKLGKKLLALRPLNKQLVAKDDSVLGDYSRLPKPGLNRSYESLIQVAFKPEWWNSDLVIRVDPDTGERRYFRKTRNRPLSTIEYTLMEYNFSLFFGLAIQAYESTLVANNTPFDQFQDRNGNKSALTNDQQNGLNLFLSKGCIGCHSGAEFTSAAVESVAKGRIARTPAFLGSLAHDTGFFNIGVRPQQEDLGVGGLDSNNNSFSETRLAQQGKFNQLFGENPPTLAPPLDPNETVIADGAFKVPGLRNVELTAPYFHNGGQLTLRQVVDFYNRGGDFNSPTNILKPLKLTEQEKEQLVAFLKSLTDERVRYQQAPFDHPQLFVPNGHPGDQNAVAIDGTVKTSDGTTQAADALLEIPAVGRNGGNPLPNFLGTYSTTGATPTP